MPSHRLGALTGPHKKNVEVVSVIPAQLRSQCDAAVTGDQRALHTDSATAALVALRGNSPRLILLAPSLLGRESLSTVRELVTRSHGAITVALVGDGPPVHQALMALGAAGVRRYLDISDRAGWSRLREMLSQSEGRTASIVLQRVVDEIGPMPPDLRHFFEVLIWGAPKVPTVRGLAPAIGVCTSTLVSRFVRAGLPTPKQYLVATRLLYVAAMFDIEGTTVGTAAYRLNFASPQSLGRHLRCQLGITPREFRARHPFNAWLERYISTVILPYTSILQGFDPVRGR